MFERTYLLGLTSSFKKCWMGSCYFLVLEHSLFKYFFYNFYLSFFWLDWAYDCQVTLYKVLLAFMSLLLLQWTICVSISVFVVAMIVFSIFDLHQQYFRLKLIHCYIFFYFSVFLGYHFYIFESFWETYLVLSASGLMVNLVRFILVGFIILVDVAFFSCCQNKEIGGKVRLIQR